MFSLSKIDVEKQDVPPTSPSSIGHDDAKEEKYTHSSSASFDVRDGDEALQLVGAERTAEFSEEFNARLRRRLVCLMLFRLSRRLG